MGGRKQRRVLHFFLPSRLPHPLNIAMEEGCHTPVRRLTTRGQLGVRSHCRRTTIRYHIVLGGAQASYARYSVSDGRGVVL